MLLHCVYCDFPSDIAKARIQGIFDQFASLVGVIPGMTDFSSGENLDFEGKSGAYRYGFVCTFEDRAAHLAYEAHPIHVAAGRELIAICNNGYDGIIVFDLATGSAVSNKG